MTVQSVPRGTEGRQTARSGLTAMGLSGRAHHGRHLALPLHLIGAAIALFTAVASNLMAYGLQHIGRGVLPDYAVRGCRYHSIQDISCGGVHFPEYWIFAPGFTAAAVCLAAGFGKAVPALQPWVGEFWASAFHATGLAGCVLLIPMAWISMGMSRIGHLTIALTSMVLLCVAMGIRAMSGAPPYARLSQVNLLATATFVLIWVCGTFTHGHTSWAEWMAFIGLIVQIGTLPVKVHTGPDIERQD